MEANKCPLYIDYVRECSEVVGNISLEFATTVRFCVSDNYKNCPFFIFINNREKCCKYFVDCPMCEYFKHNDLDRFIQMAEIWCLKAFTDCQRYKTRKSGAMPSPDMLPDGSRLQK